MRMDYAAFEELGLRTAKYRPSKCDKKRKERFKSHFGVAPDVVVDLWELLSESEFVRTNNPGLKDPDPAHLLWALMLLKKYGTMSTMADSIGVHEDTLRKWSFFISKQLQD